MRAAIKTKNLVFSYNTTHKFVYPDFELKPGNELLIWGKSGVGKTTLLHLLGLLMQPQTGQIEINGIQTELLNATQAARFRARHIGLVFQRHHFIRSINVEDNLLVANYFAKNAPEKARLQKLAAKLGIEKLLKSKTYALSGGEQQRVGIARALMNSPVLVLADEPTANLDDENCEKVYHLLAENCQENNAALVIVTHDQRLKNLIDNHLYIR